MRLKRLLPEFLRFGVSILCLICAFRGVPLSDLWDLLCRLPPLPIAAAVLTSFLAYAVMGVRLMGMRRPPLAFRSTFPASLVGLAVNNVLPAKAGEAAKAAWIGRDAGMKLDEAMGLIFFERFFDVNMLTLLSLWFMVKAEQQRYALPLVACLTAGWLFLLALRARPAWRRHLERLPLPGGLTAFLARFLDAVTAQMTPGRILWMLCSSAAVWALYALQVGIVLNGAAELGLRWTDALGVFALSSLGMLLPSSPGALGVYEAVAVAVLTFYGVPRDQALAAALVDHMVQFIPVTAAGGLVLLLCPSKEKGQARA